MFKYLVEGTRYGLKLVYLTAGDDEDLIDNSKPNKYKFSDADVMERQKKR
jgi:hypothetical protein